MCPTPIGRVHTRVATLVIPALVGLVLQLATGRDFLVIIGVFLLLGVFLDTLIYSWILKYQPPWMTFVLAAAEFGLLYVLANVLKLDLLTWQAIAWYWVVWILAISSKIALLPIFSLTYLESAGEFRRIEWSVPPQQASTPIVASAEEARNGPGPVVRAASGAHAKPLEPLPSPSGAHAIPAQPG
jgi:hypothetical protein